jgi:hypothetical protein
VALAWSAYRLELCEHIIRKSNVSLTRLVVVDAVRSRAQRLCRKSLGLTLRRPVEEGDKLIDEGAPIRLRCDIGGDQPLRLNAESAIAGPIQMLALERLSVYQLTIRPFDYLNSAVLPAL